ncbi:replication fork protection component Swi3-domain-containing protein [Mycena galericulata]|nr:replication fork protection component Swi3-domain-containing protein [Mycena galericulata]
MDSLDDIWEAPVAPRSPAQNHVDNERETLRSEPPLFLHGSDDEIMHDAPPRAANIDVDTFFEGVDGLPDGTGNESRPPLTPHQILSSSPAHHLDGDEDKGGGAKDKDAKKPKKKPMRLDEGRLIGNSGFPQLVKDTKTIKIKGKGLRFLRASDLNRLLHVYQFWTHRLYPKTPFKDTVDRVEKICHSKRMHNMLGTWRDEAHGIVKDKTPGEDDDGEAEPTEPTDPSTPGPDSDQAHYASSSSAATRPPSSIEGEGDLNDASDFDAHSTAAMDATAIMNARRAASAQLTPPRSDEDDEGWNAMDQMEDSKKSTPAPQPRMVSSVEEDADDMYIEGS